MRKTLPYSHAVTAPKCETRKANGIEVEARPNIIKRRKMK
jgi:hypothetical protein